MANKRSFRENEFLRRANEILSEYENRTKNPAQAAQQTPQSAREKAYYDAVKAYVTQSGIVGPEATKQGAGNLYAYAKSNGQKSAEVADDLLTGDKARPGYGDVRSWDWEDARQATLENETYTRFARDAGIYDVPEALTGDYIHLVSTPYLKSQQAQTAGDIVGSMAHDAAAQNKYNALAPVMNRVAEEETKNRKGQWEGWNELYNRTYQMTDENAPIYWAYADHLLNGGTKDDFDIDAYNRAWDGMDDETFNREQERLRAQYEGLDLASLADQRKIEKTWGVGQDSKTLGLAGKASTIGNEIDRRARKEELEAMAMGSEDFAEKSTWEDTYTEPEGLKRVFGDDVFVMGYDDPLRFMHVRPSKGDIQIASEYSGKVSRYADEGYDYLTEQELQVYTYLYNTDPDAAAEYLTALRPDLLRRRATVQKNYDTVTSENNVTGVIRSVGTVVTSPATAGRTLIGGLMGESDPNAAIYDLQRSQNTVRTTRGQVWGDMLSYDVLGQPVGTTIYNTLMSMGDMGMAYVVAGGPLGGSNAFAQTGMQIIMSSEAAASTLHSDLERGMPTEIALLHGLTNGAIEWWSEKGVLDDLFSPDGKFLWRVAKSGLSEGAEEVYSGTLQLVSDRLFSYMAGKESEVEQVYKGYLQTMSPAEATMATLQHYAQELALSGVSGFMSGAGLGVGTHTVNDSQARSTGKYVQSQGDIDALLGIASKMEPGTQSRQWADQLTAKKNKGSRLSNYEVGRLTMEMEADVGDNLADAPNQVMEEAIEGRLVELGEDRANAKALAPIIRKTYRGQTVAKKEFKAVKWSDAAEQTVKELSRETSDADAGRVGVDWAAKAKTAGMEATMAATDIARNVMTASGRVKAAKPAANGVAQAADKAAAKAKDRQKVRVKKSKTLPKNMVAISENGQETTGEFSRFVEEDGQLKMVVATDGGVKTVALDQAQADEGMETIFAYVEDAERHTHAMSTEEANTMAKVYAEVGGDAAAFIAGFENAYLAGYSGIEMSGNNLDDQAAQIAYEQGRAEANRDEADRVKRASAAKASSEGTVAWLGKAESNAQVRGAGDVNALSSAMETMTESQRTTAEVVQALAKKMHIDVTLFESSAEMMEGIQNGSFVPGTNRIYIDVNSGAANAQSLTEQKANGTLGYAMMKTMAHELTHYMESNSSEGYAVYKQAVKDALKESGQDWASLVRGKLDAAILAGNKLTLAGAEAEVIADASEYMLQNSAFVQGLDNSVRGKVKQFIQNFMEKVRAIFANLTGGHRESAALRQTIDGVMQYTGNLQRLWDAGIREATGRNYAENATMRTGTTVQADADQNTSKTEEAVEEWTPAEEASEDAAEEWTPAEEADEEIWTPEEDVQSTDEQLAEEIYEEPAKAVAEERTVQEVIEEPTVRELKQEAKATQRIAPQELIRGIADRFGIEIRVVDRANLLASYNPDSGVILIGKNASTGEVLYKALGMELMRHAQNSQYARQLQTAVEQAAYAGNPYGYFADLQTVADELNQRFDNYGKRKLTVDSPIVQAELFARMAAKVFGNESSMMTLIEQNFQKPTLLQRIRNALKSFVRKLRGLKTPALTPIQRAEHLLGLALKDAQKAAANPAKTAQMLKNFTDTHVDAANRQTLVAYTTMMGDEAALEVDGDRGEVQYSFGGRLSETANRSMLHEAQEMEFDDVDAETIRKKTGWYRGMDGQWRYEIDDSKASYVSAKAKNVTKLKEVFQHQKLYDAYPDIAETPVDVTEDLPENTKAGTRGKKIVLNARYFVDNGTGELDWNDKNKGTLIHEVQHLIQEEEGFTGGSNLEYWRDRYNIPSRNDRLIERLKNEEHSLFVKQADEVQDMMREREKLMYGLRRASTNGYEDDELWYFKKLNELDKAIEQKAPGLVKKIGDLFTKMQEARKNNRRLTPEELYWNTAGEIEARDTAARRTLTEDQRRETPPEINEDAVFADIRYSTRTPEDTLSIREYLSEMKPTERMNETEKILLKRYQGTLGKLREAEANADEQWQIIKTVDAIGEDGKESKELAKAKSRWKIYRNQADRYHKLLLSTERGEGFARLMATSQEVVNNYLLGSAGSIADAADALDEEVSGLERQLKKLEADVTRASMAQKTAFARGLFNQQELNDAAKKLKENYGSRMGAKTIADRLALAFGEIYADNGAEGAKRFAEAAKELAYDILRGHAYRYKSEILPLIKEEIGAFSLTEADIQEIEYAGMTVGEFKKAIAPWVKVVDGASDLSTFASNASYYGNGALGGILGDGMDGSIAMNLYNTIKLESTMEQEIGVEGMSEAEMIGRVMTDIAGAGLPLSTNSKTADYLRDELKRFAGESTEAAQRLEQAIMDARKATGKANKVWLAAVKEMETAKSAVEYYRKLDEQRRIQDLKIQKQTVLEELRSDYAQKLHDKIEKYRKEYKEREQKAREYRKVREEVNKLRRKIGRDVKRLNGLRVRETDQKHVPEELQYMADLVMETFTESSLARLAFSGSKAASLSTTYANLLKLESDATHYWDDEIEQTMQNLSDLSARYTALATRKDGAPSYFSLEGVQLEQEILTGVQDIVDNVMQMIDSQNKQFVEGRNETFEQYAEEAGQKLKGHKDYTLKSGWRGDAKQLLDELLVKGNVTPVYFFEHLGNEEFRNIFDRIRRGQSDYAKIVAQGQDVMRDAKKRHNYSKWVGDNYLTLKTAQGHSITLTREQAMWVYATAKREQANTLYKNEHLAVGGFQYKSTRDLKGEDGNRAVDVQHQLQKPDIDQIGKWLTDEQKAYADEMVEYLSTTMAEYGNEASMGMYGYRKFKEKYYFPFRTKRDQRFLRGDEGPGGDDAGTGRLKNTGFTHKVQHKANQTLVMDDFSNVVSDHIQKMATYAAMVQPVEDLKRLLNYKTETKDGNLTTLRALLGQKYGKGAQDYMSKLLKDLNGAIQSDERDGGFTSKLISAFKRGAVMASASVVLQQPTAMARAMAYISPKYFANNPFYRPSKGTWDEMMQYAGTAVIKDMGKFDVGLGLTASQYIQGEDIGVFETWRRLKNESKGKATKEAYKRLMDRLTAAPGLADQWTWGLIWKAVKNEQAAKHPGMDATSEEFLQMCGERFDDVIDHTQVYDSVLTRSNLMRSQNALDKMATSFMSEPTLSLNMLYDALVGKHSPKQRAGIIGSVIASQVLAGAMAALVQAWNDDDDERNWLEKYTDRAVGNIFDNLNPLGMIPYVSDIISVIQGYDVERPDMTVIKDIIDYAGEFFKAYEDGGAPTWKQTENFAGTLLNMVGIPAKNISREIRRTRNMILNTDWSAPNMTNVGFAAAENVSILGVYTPWGGDKKDYYNRMVSAMMNGDDELAEDYRTYMLTSKMVEEDKITQGVRDAYKERYLDGGITKDEAVRFLVENGLAADSKAAFTYVDRWDEGSENHSAYASIRQDIQQNDMDAVDEGIEELLAHGWTPQQVYSALTPDINQHYMLGTMTQAEYRRWYNTHGIAAGKPAKDENDWYWTFRELDWGKAHGGRTDGYDMHADLYTAVESGANVRAVINDYKAHGRSREQLNTAINNHYKPILIELWQTGRHAEFANMQARVLTAYEMLGYDRDQKLRTIQGWIE